MTLTISLHFASFRRFEEMQAFMLTGYPPEAAYWPMALRLLQGMRRSLQLSAPRIS